MCAGISGIPGGTPCTVINANDGKLYLDFPAQDFCCTCGSAFTIRSDWLLSGGTTYTGTSVQFGRPADGWLKYGNEANHYYATQDGTQAPIGYREHKSSGLKQWEFLQWAAGPQDSSLFDPPSDSCKAAQCQSHACQVLS